MTLLYSVYQAMGRSNMTLVMACGGGGGAGGGLMGTMPGKIKLEVVFSINWSRQGLEAGKY